MEFINRKAELDYLNGRYDRSQAELIILFGKRRVGKTELVKQFIKEKRAVYYLADKRTMNDQLAELGRLLGAYFGDERIEKGGFTSWVDALQYVAEKVGDERFVLAIDEYPYLIESDSSVQSQFQKGFELYLKQSRVLLILTGSSISMMENEVLGHRSPLYGRRTGDLLVQPLGFRQAHRFFPHLDFASFLQIYAVAGGMPEYLLQLQENAGGQELPLEYTGGADIWSVVERAVFTRNSFLYREAEYVLKEELREPRTYMAILRAIALGNHRAAKIAVAAGIDQTAFPKYFGVLNQLKILFRDTPVTEKNPEKSKKSLYFFGDNFMRFWFRFVYPNKSNLEIGNFGEAHRKFNLHFPPMVQSTYEAVTRELIMEHQGRLFGFERVGRWWQDGKNVKSTEIDIVATNADENKMLFGEAKWSERPVGLGVFADLKDKAARVEWGSRGRKDFFALFSRSGFTDELKEVAARESSVLLIEKDTMV